MIMFIPWWNPWGFPLTVTMKFNSWVFSMSTAWTSSPGLRRSLWPLTSMPRQPYWLCHSSNAPVYSWAFAHTALSAWMLSIRSPVLPLTFPYLMISVKPFFLPAVAGHTAIHSPRILFPSFMMHIRICKDIDVWIFYSCDCPTKRQPLWKKESCLFCLLLFPQDLALGLKYNMKQQCSMLRE